MIELQQVSFWYPDSERAVISGVDLTIAPGTFNVVIGRTGAGKSTFLGLLTGLVPHFTGGHLTGVVRVAGRSTATHPPRDLADVVGYVGQDPVAGFVTDSVEEELAYGMEQLAVPTGTMRQRVEETLDLLGIADLRDRPLATLSGGQAQRVAIGAVLTSHPQILVLDEPTSALDPTAAEEVLAILTRLVDDLGITVIVAEHRLERVAQLATQLIHLPGDGSVAAGDPADVLIASEMAPPVVELARVAAWAPVPVSVKAARPHANRLRETLPSGVTELPPLATAPLALQSRGIVVQYPGITAVNDVDIDLVAGQVAAVMGRNGSGKSSLLWAWQGAGVRRAGTVSVAGEDPGQRRPAQARALVGLVPQTPADLLYAQTVAQECDQADRDANAPAGTCAKLLDQLVPGIAADHHPRDLSEGQRLALVLAVQLTPDPPVVLLDEPTRGLDAPAKTQLIALLRRLAAAGTAVVLATHDVEVVAAVADRVIVMAQGEVVADGPTRQVVGGSPAFAPQISKLFGPQFLTVAEVRRAIVAAKSKSAPKVGRAGDAPPRSAVAGDAPIGDAS